MELVADPVRFFEKYGVLHDVFVKSIRYAPDQQEIVLSIDDLNRDFDDTPSYPGRRSCDLVFRQARNVFADIECSEGLKIYSAEVSSMQIGYEIAFTLSLGGGRVTEGKDGLRWDFETFEVH